MFNVNIAMAARITKEAIIAKGCQNQAETLGYAVTLCQLVSQSEEPQSAENPVKTEEKTEQKNSQTTGEPQL